ncbi:uncharacterized protein BYT42DRAFT_499333, partial [Radiomyces spectabilis]|uniref:uncharacterized protein n=1 Tax=Radiomyces spectabilis TaxID=64574 RepID=UPI0022210013
KRPKLCFLSPLRRGQTLTFSLENVVPEDHVIVSSFSSTWSVNTTAKEAAMMERYFVRPSAGRMVADHHTDIMLFLNQVPPLNPGEVLKDKIIVRWAVIQRNTQVDRWVQNLSESTRRKWLEMVAERWPDQVVLRETKIKIRFV